MNIYDYLDICSLALIAHAGVIVVMLRCLSNACGVTRKGFIRQAAMSPPKTIPTATDGMGDCRAVRVAPSDKTPEGQPPR
jgi:hypothetical protein